MKDGGHSIPYSKIDPDIIFEQGRIVDQWTVKYSNPDTSQYAVIKIRFSHEFEEIIDFDVEINNVPMHIDHHGKDVIVQFKMYDGFNANKTFWTDTNGLEMLERRLNWRQTFIPVMKQNISSNYYPITSAIAIRDIEK